MSAFSDTSSTFTLFDRCIKKDATNIVTILFFITFVHKISQSCAVCLLNYLTYVKTEFRVAKFITKMYTI